MNDKEAINEFVSVYGKFVQFEVDSTRHIMDLIMKPPSALPAVCFQVHEMPDGSNVVFWNFGLTANESWDLLDQYFREYPEKLPDGNKTKIDDGIIIACRDEKFINMFKSAAPIHRHELSTTEFELVSAVVNANWPLPVDYGGGLDGHSYVLKVYGKNAREIERWCYIPKDRVEFPPLVDFFIELADLQPKRAYEVTGFYRW